LGSGLLLAVLVALAAKEWSLCCDVLGIVRDAPNVTWNAPNVIRNAPNVIRNAPNVVWNAPNAFWDAPNAFGGKASPARPMDNGLARFPPMTFGTPPTPFGEPQTKSKRFQNKFLPPQTAFGRFGEVFATSQRATFARLFGCP